MIGEALRYNKEWTLFLDRDGVINEEIEGTYVTDWKEFRFYQGSVEAISTLARIFGTIIVVTNQRGVGRGVMSIESLKEIHANMLEEIGRHGGRVDRIYSCTAVENEDNNRKPNTGMAMQAREDFGNIDFRKSVMVGNNISDMLFGKRMAMHTVFLSTTKDPVALPHELVDEQFESLKLWTDSIRMEQVMTSLN